MTPPPPPLPASYRDARDAFRARAAALGAALSAVPVGVATSDDGTPLALTIDVAVLGAADAPAALFIASGTHGVEGYAGALCQLRLFDTWHARLAELPLACVLVHAVNPWGFHHDSRVTAEGVDLNRNFVDFPRAPGEPSAYARYHDVLVTRYRPLPGGAWNELRFLANGLTAARRRALQAAITAGQYDHPDGLFYGGSAPTASRLGWEGIVRAHAAGRRRIGLLDIHTGLGPRGHGELISTLPPSAPQFATMQSWFGGELVSMATGESVSAAVDGTLTAGFGRIAPCDSHAVGLEFGTCAPLAVLAALRADQRARNLGAACPPAERDRVRRRMRDAFRIADDGWRDAVVRRFDEVAGRMARGLSGLTGS